MKRYRPVLDKSRDVETFDSFLTPEDWAFTAQTIRRAARLVRQSFESRMMAGLSTAARVLASNEADHLKDVADQKLKQIDPLQVMADVRLAAVALLLEGLALENLMKAYFVQEHPPASNPGKLPKELGTHELHVLAGRASELSLSKDDRAFLERLTQFVKWAGRYPIPRSVEDMKADKAPGLQHSLLRSDDFSRVDRLFNFILAKVRQYPPGWL